jgi:hypothetical protein
MPWPVVEVASWARFTALAALLTLATFRCRNDDRHRPGMRERAGG